MPREGYIEHTYSGLIYCDECGYRMQCHDNSTYSCDNYIRHGFGACQSHRIQSWLIDIFLMKYLELLYDVLSETSSKFDAENLTEVVQSHQERLKQLKLQLLECNKLRVQQIVNEPENSCIVNSTFDILEAQLVSEIKQVDLLMDNASEELTKSNNFEKDVKQALSDISNILTNPVKTKRDLRNVIKKILIKNKVMRVELKQGIGELLLDKDKIDDALRTFQEEYYSPMERGVACPDCGNDKMSKGKTRYVCNSCGATFFNANMSQYQKDVRKIIQNVKRSRRTVPPKLDEDKQE